MTDKTPKKNPLADVYWPSRRAPDQSLGEREIDELIEDTGRRWRRIARLLVWLLFALMAVSLAWAWSEGLTPARAVVVPVLSEKAFRLMVYTDTLQGGAIKEPGPVGASVRALARALFAPARRARAAVRLWWVTR